MRNNKRIPFVVLFIVFWNICITGSGYTVQQTLSPEFDHVKGAGQFGDAIWILADYGLIRYDTLNNTTTVYSYPPETTYSSLKTVEVDHDDLPWISSGRGIWHFTGQQWEHYTPFSERGIPVNVLTLDNDGLPWVASREGLARYNGLTWEIEDTPSEDYISVICFDSANNMWIGTYNTHLYSRSGIDWIEHDPPSDLNNVKITFMLFDGNDVLTIVSKQWIFRNIDNRWMQYSPGYDLSTTSFRITSEGYPVIANTRGAMVFKNNRINTIPIHGIRYPFYWLNQWDEASFVTVPQYITSNETSTWCIMGNGIIAELFNKQYVDYSAIEGYYRYTLNTAPSSNPTVIDKADDGSIWFGTSDMGLVSYNDGTWSHWTFKDTFDYLPSYIQIDAIAAGSHIQYAWSNDNGLFIIESESIEHFTADNGLPVEPLTILEVDHNGTLWAGTQDSGLLRLKDGEFTLLTEADGLPSNMIIDIECDAEGNLWISANSIFRLDGDEWVLVYPFSNFQLSDGGITGMWAFSDTKYIRYNGTKWDVHYSPEKITSIDFDPQDDLWFMNELSRTGGFGDIFYYNVFNKLYGTLLEQYPQISLGLCEDFVIDENGFLWIVKKNNYVQNYIGGIYCYNLEIPTSIDANYKTPAALTLLSNYPNPFNPSTIITFRLPRSGHTKLEIFNINGQKVDTLVDEWRDTGQHSVVWDGTKFASGVYFYRIEAGGYTATKRMVLMK